MKVQLRGAGFGGQLGNVNTGQPQTLESELCGFLLVRNPDNRLQLAHRRRLGVVVPHISEGWAKSQVFVARDAKEYGVLVLVPGGDLRRSAVVKDARAIRLETTAGGNCWGRTL